MSETSTVPPLDDEIHDVADRIVRRYPVARSALLPLLHLVQSVQNHITDQGIAFCAEKVGLTRAEVGAVATFYTMYKRQPVGDWLLSVCTNPVCKQAGGQEIYENYVDALGGHADPDTKVTVEHAECLGICDGAPVVQVNYEMFGPMTVAEGQQLLEACRKGDPPVSPWSGEKPPTFAEVERDLSGANDAWEDQLHLAAQQQIAFESPPTYRTGETDLPVTHPGGDPAGVGGAAFRAAAAGGSTNGDGPTGLGVPEVAVDADDGDPDTPLPGDTAQRIGEGHEPALDVDDEPVGTPVSREEFADVVDELEEETAAEIGDIDVDGEPVATPVSPREFADVVDDHADQLLADDADPGETSDAGIVNERALDADPGSGPTTDAEATAATPAVDEDVTDDAAVQPDAEPGDLEEALATDAPDAPVTADDTMDTTAEPEAAADDDSEA